MSNRVTTPKSSTSWITALCLALASAASVGAEVGIQVTEHRRTDRGVESVIFSMRDTSQAEEGQTDPAGSLVLPRACAQSESLRARPRDIWYYRSGKEPCEDSVVLAVKKHRTELRVRGGQNSPLHFNLGFAFLLGEYVDLELGSIVWDRELGEQTPRWAGGVALNFHPFPRGPVDVYGGPVVSYLTGRRVVATTSSTRTNSVAPIVVTAPIELSVEDEAVIGANLGIDFPLRTKGIAFNVAFQYLPTSPEVRAASGAVVPEVDEEIVVGSVGLSWRF